MNFKNNDSVDWLARILSHCEIPSDPSGCWLWKGVLDDKGYGRISKNKRLRGVHRLVYEIKNGPIPKEKPCICHSCDVPNCVNPNHLWAGTIEENNKDKALKGRAPKGENHYEARLTTAKAAEIKTHRYLSNQQQRDLAKKFGVTPSAIRGVYRGKTWKHVLAVVA